MGYSTVIRATRDCTAFWVEERTVPCTAHDIELASATVRTELLTPEQTWWREQTRRDLAKHYGREYKPMTRKSRAGEGGELTPATGQALAVIREAGPLSLREIEQRAGLHRTTVHDALVRLTDRGLVRVVSCRVVRGCSQSPLYAAVNDD